MKIGFWSPCAGTAGASSAAMTFSVLLSKMHNLDCLLMQSSSNKLNNLQRPLLGRVDGEDAQMWLSDIGIDAIMRHVGSGDRSAATIADCCVKINEKLMFVPPTRRTKEIYEGDFSRYTDIIPSLLDNYHTVSVFDIEAGFSGLSLKLLRNMDIVVVCLPQNPVVIEEYMENASVFPTEKVLYLFGRYDEDSVFNKANLCKLYKLPKNKCMVMPYCTEYLDACNQSSIRTFLERYIELNDKLSSLYDFFVECKDIVNTVVKVSGILSSFEEVEGGGVRA